MHTVRRRLLWINGIGGVAVLASYAWGLAANPSTRGEVWGGVPDSWRGLYTASMLAAAAGYFAFSHFVLFRLEPERTRIAGRFGFGIFQGLYAAILLPSALWMPLTFAMLDEPSDALWWAIRATLALVAAGSLALLAALVALDAPGAPRARRIALLGGLAFCFQTAVLDALLWPAWFPV